MDTVKMTIGDVVYQIKLYQGPGPAAFLAGLPAEVSMSRWGEEFYGGISAQIREDDTLRDIFEVGEVAYWPPGNAFCIFFGPTPASTDSRPRMASPGVPLGRIEGDVSALKKMGSSVRARIAK